MNAAAAGRSDGPVDRGAVRSVSLIGAPTDVGAGTRGASMGPEALRVADIQPTLESHGLEVIDRGNLAGPPNPWQAPVDGYRHLSAVVAWSRLINFELLVDTGMISPSDVDLFHFVETADEAWNHLEEQYGFGRAPQDADMI